MAGAAAATFFHRVDVDRLLEHLDPATVQPGDRVLGTLPVNFAARVCAQGARY